MAVRGMALHRRMRRTRARWAPTFPDRPARPHWGPNQAYLWLPRATSPSRAAHQAPPQGGGCSVDMVPTTDEPTPKQASDVAASPRSSRVGLLLRFSHGIHHGARASLCPPSKCVLGQATSIQHCTLLGYNGHP